MNERDDILVARPQRTLAAPLAGGAGTKSVLVVAPATAAAMPGGAWPEELQVGAAGMGGLNGSAWGCLGVGSWAGCWHACLMQCPVQPRAHSMPCP